MKKDKYESNNNMSDNKKSINKYKNTNKVKTQLDSFVKCPYFKKCGGCQYINLSYEEQLKKKEQTVSKYLKDIATSQHIKIDSIIGSESPYNYRNKVHSVFGRDGKGKVVRGIYKEDSHKIVDIKECLLEDKTADAIIEEVKRLLPSFKYKVFDEDTGFGWLRHLLVRKGEKGSSKTANNDSEIKKDEKVTKTSEYMLVLVTSSVPFPGKNNFVKAIRTKFPEISTIVQNINDKRTSMILGDRNIVCYGKGFIEDELLGLTFRISPNSFYQVNPHQTSKLYKKAIEYAGDISSKTVIDTYCGTGTIGMCMAEKAKNVIGIELNPSAVRDAISNAKANNIKNIEFIKADATKWMQEYQEKIKDSDDYVLVMDPPRSGSTEEFITAASNAGIKNIVYVSCNPETLSRDLKSFIKKKYSVAEITPVDMFPWTEHVETVCLLSKRKAD